MSNYKANKTFFHGGVQILKGQYVDSTSELVALYPSNYTAEDELSGTIANDITFSGTLGPVLHATTGTLSYRITVNAGGTLLTESV